MTEVSCLLSCGRERKKEIMRHRCEKVPQHGATWYDSDFSVDGPQWGHQYFDTAVAVT